MRRPDDATLTELRKATEWLAHSVRGFLSGAVSKKMALKLESTKAEDGERSYSIKAKRTYNLLEFRAAGDRLGGLSLFGDNSDQRVGDISFM